MRDEDKTKEQLINELVKMRRRIAGLQKVETERKQAEEELRLFSHVVESSVDGMAIGDLNGKITYANKTFVRMFGYSEEELIGKDIAFIYSEDQIPKLEEAIKATMEGSWTGELIGKRKDGELFPVAISSSRVVGDKGNVIAQIASHKDITERKQAEEELRESEERYRSLVNLGGTIGEAIVMLQDTEQGEGIQTFVSNQWHRITGYSKKELRGMSFFDLLTPKYREASLKRHKRKMSGEAVPGLFEVSIIRKDGTEVPIELTDAYTTYKGERANVVYVRDTTERKQAEKKMVEYEELTKLKSDLLSMVSHELRTPLAIIKGYSTMLVDYARRLSTEEREEHLVSIDKATDRLTELVDHLLDMSRMDAGLLKLERMPTSISKVIEQAAAEAQLRAPEHNIVVHIRARLPTVNIDAKRIRQVLDNLIDNACKYSEEGTEVAISARQEGQELVVSVADQGAGIPAEDLERVFDRMYRAEQRLTPKAEGLGLGLGLSICKGLVEAHSGRIWVESEPGKGSTFYFALPLGTE